MKRTRRYTAHEQPGILAHPNNLRTMNHDRPAAGPQREQAESSREQKLQLISLANQGRYAEAEQQALAMTSQFPGDGFGWHMLGSLLRTRGQNQDALTALQRAATLRPDLPEAHSNVGSVLLELGRAAEAEASCRRALQLKPDFPAAHCNLGNALRNQGRPREAEASCRRALELKPDFPEALCNLANALKDLGELEEAAVALRRAIEIRPRYAEAYTNLGGILHAQGRLGEAEKNLRRAIEIKPHLVEACSNLGNTLRACGKLEEAEASCRRALEIDPRSVEACSNLGTVLGELGRLSEAEAVFRRAVELKPELPEAHCNLGHILQAQARLDEAAASYRQALEFKPAFAKAHSNLLLCSTYLSDLSPAELYAEHKQWEKQQAGGCVRMAAGAIDTNPQRRLRVGYVSPDLRQHSVAYFLEPLLRAHDHTEVEVFCYSDVPRPDAVTLRLRALADHWVECVGMSDESLARRIADDRIDILVDLAGHTANNRLLLFARKPAPVQVTWLGYPNTTGLRSMDYRLVDEITDPPGEADSLATETLVRLEKGFLSYEAPPSAPAPTARSSYGRGALTFGSFNNTNKLSPACLETWGAVLRRVPGSQLLLKGRIFDDDGSRNAFIARLTSHGVPPDRVIIRGRTPGLTEHLALYSQVDIALDSFPYNGTTTTCEALWMGVPVVTLRGDRHVGRVGASLLTRVGLTGLVAASPEVYVDIAAALAQDSERLKHFHHTLRDRMAQSALCDAPAFGRQIESAYRQMWHRYCAGMTGAGIR